jgi:hypothetical protein
MTHKSLITEICNNPQKIEHGFRVFSTEFSLGHGRIDIVGMDKNRVLCLVEAKVHNGEIPQGEKQIKQYREQMLKLLEYAGVSLSIRIFVVTLKRTVDLGVKTSVPIAPPKVSSSIPLSREIFGLKKEK